MLRLDRGASSAARQLRQRVCEVESRDRIRRGRGRRTEAPRSSSVEQSELWRRQIERLEETVVEFRRFRDFDGDVRNTVDGGVSSSARRRRVFTMRRNAYLVEFDKLGSRNAAAEVGKESFVLVRSIDLALLDL